ncbi:MAG: lipoprotein [bacterium]|nr:lipoprotein [bacterium]
MKKVINTAFAVLVLAGCSTELPTSPETVNVPKAPVAQPTETKAPETSTKPMPLGTPRSLSLKAIKAEIRIGERPTALIDLKPEEWKQPFDYLRLSISVLGKTKEATMSAVPVVKVIELPVQKKAGEVLLVIYAQSSDGQRTDSATLTFKVVENASPSASPSATPDASASASPSPVPTTAPTATPIEEDINIF